MAQSIFVDDPCDLMLHQNMIIRPWEDRSVMTKPGVRSSSCDRMLRYGHPAHAFFVAASTFFGGFYAHFCPGVSQQRVILPKKRRKARKNWRGPAISRKVPSVAIFLDYLWRRLGESDTLQRVNIDPCRIKISYLLEVWKYAVPIPFVLAGIKIGTADLCPCFVVET